MSETAIVKNVLLRLSGVPGVRVWRQNVGMGIGWGVVHEALQLMGIGQVKKAAALLRSRPIQFGIPGQADINGIGPGGKRIEIECKTAAGRQREEQKSWQKMIEKHGGIYLLVRSEDDAEKQLRDRMGL